MVSPIWEYILLYIFMKSRVHLVHVSLVVLIVAFLHGQRPILAHVNNSGSSTTNEVGGLVHGRIHMLMNQSCRHAAANTLINYKFTHLNMETQFLKSFTEVLDWCYKDSETLLYLRRKKPQSLNLELLQVDIISQTISSQIDTPLFENVDQDDCRYNILYCKTSSKVLMIYPCNAIVVYDSENFQIEQVVQSLYNILCPMITPILSNQKEQVQSDRLIVVSMDDLEDLSRKQPKSQMQVKTTYKGVLPTDLTKVKGVKSRFLITFTNGKIWEIDPFDTKQAKLFSLDLFKDQIGEQKLCQINCIDHTCMNKLNYLAFGDIVGRISVLICQKQDQSVIYHEQLCYNQIVSIKFVSKSCLILAMITSEGTLSLQKLVLDQISKKYSLIKLSSVSMFEEVANHFNFANQHLQANKSLQIYHEDNFTDMPVKFAVSWPERVLYKLNKKTKEKRILVENKLSLFKIFNKIQPMSTSMASVIYSPQAPLAFDQILPKRQDEQLDTDPYVFLIDYDDNEKKDYFITAYQTFDGQKKKLINVSRESGISQSFTISKLDVRPKVSHEVEQYRFLVQIIIQESHESLSLVFHYNLSQGCLISNVQQFNGINSLFIGPHSSCNPGIQLLQEDNRTLLSISFDSVMENKLPRGHFQLLSKVQQIFSSPFRGGMCVVYESMQDNQIRFSRNRLENNPESDMNLLSISKYSFKLSYDEKVFCLQWNQFNVSETIRAAIATNQRLCITDGNLQLLTSISLQSLVSSLMWLGNHTVLYSTERHLSFLVEAKQDNTGILVSFNSQDSLREVLIAATADRLITAKASCQNKINIMTKSVILLEPLLIGYLTSLNKKEVNFETIKQFLTLLDTPIISPNLIQRLTKLGYLNTANHLLNNPNAVQFDILQKWDIMKKLGCYDIMIEQLFLNKDLEKDQERSEIMHKLHNEADYQVEKLLLDQIVEPLAISKHYKQAYYCVELLQNTKTALQILELSGNLNKAKSLIEEGRLDITNKMDGISYLEQKLKVKLNGVSLQQSHEIQDYSYQVWGFNAADIRDEEFKVQFSPKIKDWDIKSVNRLSLGYDDVPFSYKVQTKENQHQSVSSVINDNLGSWLGIDSLVADNGGGPVVFQPLSAQLIDPSSNKDQEERMADEEMGADDIDEKQSLVLYWRCDEGKGLQINDMTDNELHTSLKNSMEWSTEFLEEGQPLDFEDKWGKTNTPSYAVMSSETGLIAQINQQIQGKVMLKNNFCLELWMLQNSFETFTVILLKNLKISIKDLKEIIIEYNGKSSSQQIKPLKLNSWHHFAFNNCLNKEIVEVFHNSLLACTFTNISLSSLSFAQVKLLQGKITQFTEVRLWSMSLSQKIIKENFKLPLAMLYEQKRAIKIKIRKQQQQQNDNEEQKTSGIKKLGGLKKPGGLKMQSQFDQKQKASEIIQADDNQTQYDMQQQIASQDQKESQQASNDFFAFGFESQQLPMKNQIQDNTFDAFGSSFVQQKQEPQAFNDFGFGFSQPLSQQEKETYDINDYSNPINNDQSYAVFEFDSYSQQPQSKVQEQSRDSFNFNAKQTLSSFKKDSIISLEDNKQQIRDQSQEKLNITEPLSFENQKQDEQEESFSSSIQSIIENLKHSNLAEADKLIQKLLLELKHTLKQLQSKEQKDNLKRQVRSLIVYKFASNISSQIAQLKGEMGDKISSDDAKLTKIASLSNLLIILKVQDNLKRSYLQFAINSNIKVKNFAATYKIVSYYRQAIKSMEAKEHEKVESIEAICQKYKCTNYNESQDFLCPQCQEQLPFGLATPQCSNCSAKIIVCYKTLKPITELESLRCLLCLSRFHSSQLQKGSVCPYCSMAKLDSSDKQ